MSDPDSERSASPRGEPAEGDRAAQRSDVATADFARRHKRTKQDLDDSVNDVLPSSLPLIPRLFALVLLVGHVLHIGLSSHSKRVIASEVVVALLLTLVAAILLAGARWYAARIPYSRERQASHAALNLAFGIVWTTLLGVAILAPWMIGGLEKKEKNARDQHTVGGAPLLALLSYFSVVALTFDLSTTEWSVSALLVSTGYAVGLIILGSSSNTVGARPSRDLFYEWLFIIIACGLPSLGVSHVHRILRKEARRRTALLESSTSRRSIMGHGAQSEDAAALASAEESTSMAVIAARVSCVSAPRWPYTADSAALFASYNALNDALGEVLTDTDLFEQTRLIHSSSQGLVAAVLDVEEGAAIDLLVTRLAAVFQDLSAEGSLRGLGPSAKFVVTVRFGPGVVAHTTTGRSILFGPTLSAALADLTDPVSVSDQRASSMVIFDSKVMTISKLLELQTYARDARSWSAVVTWTRWWLAIMLLLLLGLSFLLDYRYGGGLRRNLSVIRSCLTFVVLFVSFDVILRVPTRSVLLPVAGSISVASLLVLLFLHAMTSAATAESQYLYFISFYGAVSFSQGVVWPRGWGAMPLITAILSLLGYGAGLIAVRVKRGASQQPVAYYVEALVSLVILIGSGLYLLYESHLNLAGSEAIKAGDSTVAGHGAHPAHDGDDGHGASHAAHGNAHAAHAEHDAAPADGGHAHVSIYKTYALLSCELSVVPSITMQLPVQTIVAVKSALRSAVKSRAPNVVADVIVMEPTRVVTLFVFPDNVAPDTAERELCLLADRVTTATALMRTGLLSLRASVLVADATGSPMFACTMGPRIDGISAGLDQLLSGGRAEETGGTRDSLEVWDAEHHRFVLASVFGRVPALIDRAGGAAASTAAGRTR